MKIDMRGVDGRMGGVIVTGVELGALMYVTRVTWLCVLTFVSYRSGIEIETLATIEIDRETDIGTMMDIVRAVGIDLEIDEDLGIGMA